MASVTGQNIVNAAFTILGILEQGGAPSVSDSNDCLADLNAMWDAWGIDEGIIYAVASAQYALTANTASYPVGPAAASPFNIAIPPRIYNAFMLIAFGAGTVRKKLNIVDEPTYHGHADLASSALVSDELYIDWNINPSTGAMTIYLFPVPTVPATTKLELEQGAQFVAWTLGGSYFLPEGFQDAIQWALAYREIARFGAAVDPRIVQTVQTIGPKAENRIRAMNAMNRKLAPGKEAPPEMANAAPGLAPGTLPASLAR